MDIMLDLETLGFRPECVILTFGAIKFDPYNPGLEPGPGIYHRISVDDQVALGRTIDQSTVDWWGTQDPAVMEEALGEEGRISVHEFAASLNKFLVGANCIWAQGPAFDIVIIENLFLQLGLPVPWQFWQIRDSRTLFGVHGDPREKGREAAHNALADCYYQAVGVQQIYKRLGIKSRFAK
jgi:hypothetical protein